MIIPEKQNDNRRLFRKGQSGNPNGRPKKTRCIPDILERIGKEKLMDDPIISEVIKEKFQAFKDGKIKKLDAILEMVYIYALKGQAWAVQFIAERTEGKITQPVEISDDRVIIDIPDVEEPQYTDPGNDDTQNDSNGDLGNDTIQEN